MSAKPEYLVLLSLPSTNSLTYYQQLNNRSVSLTGPTASSLPRRPSAYRGLTRAAAWIVTQCVLTTTLQVENGVCFFTGGEMRDSEG